MAEISVTGNKKIATLQKEFNKQFPYLQLYLYDESQRNESYKIFLNGDKTLASVRRKDTGGTISIAGNKKVKTLEAEFDKVFGLYAQVGWTAADGVKWYSIGSSDDKTISGLNAQCEKDGHKKGVWK